ncbi:MAG: hypothetical protein ACMXYK_00780 [Candidatus Woesearchaeota archaeon]
MKYSVHAILVVILLLILSIGIVYATGPTHGPPPVGAEINENNAQTQTETTTTTTSTQTNDVVVTNPFLLVNDFDEEDEEDDSSSTQTVTTQNTQTLPPPPTAPGAQTTTTQNTNSQVSPTTQESQSNTEPIATVTPTPQPTGADTEVPSDQLLFNRNTNQDTTQAVPQISIDYDRISREVRNSIMQAIPQQEEEPSSDILSIVLVSLVSILLITNVVQIGIHASTMQKLKQTEVKPLDASNSHTKNMQTPKKANPDLVNYLQAHLNMYSYEELYQSLIQEGISSEEIDLAVQEAFDDSSNV